jgi:diguanylate cyclase (GGDEF)-like protein
MRGIFFAQICDTLNTGFVVLDREFRVVYWNRWMEIQSGLAAGRMVGAPLFDFFPSLNEPVFIRHCRTVFTFGHYCFLSQHLHRYLFPFKPVIRAGPDEEFMQQSCTIFPLRSEQKAIEYICVTVNDVSEVVNYQNKLLQMSKTDGLTGVFNRRYLEERLGEEFERQRRHRRPLSVAILDLDHFKRVNDTYGHQCGDQILKDLVPAVRTSLRSTDIFARYGGEEFCCVFPETGLADALSIAQRIRATVERRDFRHKEAVIRITASLGVSTVDAATPDADSLLSRADEALYRAKQTGRNRVVVLP